MDKKTVGLIGAVAGLATMGSAHAAAAPGHDVSEAMQASSYADLLKPVPDAVALLKADDATRVQIQRINGYVYFNYGPPPPPPYAYYQPYLSPGLSFLLSWLLPPSPSPSPSSSPRSSS